MSVSTTSEIRSGEAETKPLLSVWVLFGYIGKHVREFWGRRAICAAKFCVVVIIRQLKSTLIESSACFLRANGSYLRHFRHCSNFPAPCSGALWRKRDSSVPVQPAPGCRWAETRPNVANKSNGKIGRWARRVKYCNGIVGCCCLRVY